jgi:TetR/AcrR family transcriptional repressor of nem operon
MIDRSRIPPVTKARGAGPGRPREFDADAALGKMTDLFWERGYEAVSVRDLAAAAGVNIQSLYAAFGDKRQIYEAAIARYERDVVDKALAMLAAPGPPRARLDALFSGVIDAAVAGDRRGCFLCNAVVDRPGDGEIAGALARGFARLEDALAAALAGDPRYAKDGKARRRAAQHLLAAYVGMRVLARGGARVAALKNMRDAALAAAATDIGTG